MNTTELVVNGKDGQNRVILPENDIYVSDVLDIYIQNSEMEGEEHLKFAESIYYYILNNPISVQKNQSKLQRITLAYSRSK